MLVYEATDPQGDEHLVALSALLDEPLETAFLALTDGYAASQPAPPAHRVLQLRSAIERWSFTDEIARHTRQPEGNRRRRRRGGRKHRPVAAQQAPRPGQPRAAGSGHDRSVATRAATAPLRAQAGTEGRPRCDCCGKGLVRLVPGDKLTLDETMFFECCACPQVQDD